MWTLLAMWALGVFTAAVVFRMWPRAQKLLSKKQISRHEMLRATLDVVPMAMVLYADSGLIVYTNAAARQLFFEGQVVEGKNFLSLLQSAPAALRQALLADGDGLFTVEHDGEADTYHLARRSFDIDSEPHTLLTVKPLTHELSRQEVDVWRKVIRVMSHELNNSLAPIASLVHSARLLSEQPDSASKLDRVFSVIEERTRHLHEFLEGYARLARLPRPRPVSVRWDSFMEAIRALFPDISWKALPETPGHFDASQVEQVLINLIRNAIDAGSPSNDITVEVLAEEGGVRVNVADRGKGLSPEVLENALLPFFSTKEKGSGIGLALCREVIEGHGGRLRLANRADGGAIVSFWLPPARHGTTASSRARITLTSPGT